MSTDLTTTTPPADEYTGEHMKTLKDAAHIRQNPDMYVGNTQQSGLHHLVYEIVYNSVDEALAGYCKHINIVLHVDGSISVIDDGRGIPVDMKPSGKSTLEEALTIVGTSAKFDNAAYKVSAGLHGMGAKAVNALSEWMEAEVWRNNRVYKIEFERGYATSELKDMGPAPTGKTGTTITFKPDAEIFHDLKFHYETLAERFRELAFLNKGLNLTLTVEETAKIENFCFEGGIAEFVEYINTGETVEHPPIYLLKKVDNITVEVALQYSNRDEELIRCYTNNAYNPVGGTHLSGFRAGLTKAMNAYGKKEGHFKDGLELKGEDFREGLTSIVSVGHPDPHFEAQTKIKLNNPEVEGITSSVVYEALTEYLERNPDQAKRICRRIVLSAEARIAAKKARDALIDRKRILSGGGLPGKLMDCTTRNREESELFLVEGDSAGGSAESGRDRHYQAVLPLRGKVLNVERARLEKLLKNEEIANLIAAVGVDIGNADEIGKIRYGKIVILTDADVDGQHIRTLLLTFFFRQMRKLIEAGHVYVARPPLFKVTQRKETRFVQTRELMTTELMSRGLNGTSLKIQPGKNRSNTDAERSVAGEELKKLVQTIEEIQSAFLTLERRGQTPDNFLQKYIAGKGLPHFHVRLGVRDHFFHSHEEVEAFRLSESTRLGRELTISDSALSVTGEATAAAAKAPIDADRFTVDQWHEIRSLNRSILKLQDQKFLVEDLVPLPRIAGREPPVRFILANGDHEHSLNHLCELAHDVRRLGEKGLTITRFKGLGEMDPEELWSTTLDPKHRTLLRVTMDNAVEAEKRFRMLMGEDVEGRRDFIMNRSIESTDEIDYGA